MAREHNYLLGYGERLTTPVPAVRGGGPKNPPYVFEYAKKRISAQLKVVREKLTVIPEKACPNDEAVLIITMHPRYLSKSDYPAKLFREVGLTSIGNRSVKIVPERWGIKNPPEEAITEEIFVSCKRQDISSWADHIEDWSIDNPWASELLEIEMVEPYNAESKIRSIPPSGDTILLEVVLHNGSRPEIIDAFKRYVATLNAFIYVDKIRNANGLTFIPVKILRERLTELAQFTFVRIARGMPSLRPLHPSLIRDAATSYNIVLPDVASIDESTRIVIFDGGIPFDMRVPLERWVKLIEPIGIEKAVPELEKHGLGVTSAFLFGPIKTAIGLSQPFCNVDHVRVIDEQTGSDGSLEYIDVLNRIVDYLDQHKGIYQFVNISLGPNMAIEDDEVSAWTALLDDRLANGIAIATIAAGNDGEMDPLLGLNRIQPPADGVNVIAVGSSDRMTLEWQRASYSCVGPGRCPGIVKPDGVIFGGSSAEMFGVVSLNCKLRMTAGTSFAAPFALRSAASIKAQLGTTLTPLAIKALMLHRAKKSKSHNQTEIGWGHFEDNPDKLITCEDDEALVVFQGELPLKQYLRAIIPMPTSLQKGKITIRATLVISPEVDPEHPGTYTRSGLEVHLRPNESMYKTYDNGRISTYPKSVSFFSASNMYGAAEYDLRKEGIRWESCIRGERTFLASKLKNPLFDIYYHSRRGGATVDNITPIPYALIISMQSKNNRDLYDRVVRTYSNILLPIRPRMRIKIS